jgi:2-desacetyl-2-hydroxyethyl bacteriochlorophyllide A dehydrogenase
MTQGKMKAVVVREAGKLEVAQVDLPKPEARQVRIRVEACGVCHSDAIAIDGTFPGIRYPIIPGHEVSGTIDEVGSDVFPWKVGQRVCVGWYGYQCGYCHACRSGELALCENSKITGLQMNGGYAQYMVSPVSGLAAVPSELSAIDAAPLVCAGITTFNSLRNSGARPGDVVAVVGIGGLGHLALQFANKMGFNVVAISRGKDSEPQARELGARSYIATDSMNAVEELKKLGGAKVILATAPNSALIGSLVEGLGNDGKLLLVAHPDEAISFNAAQLIRKRAAIQGWNSGVANDSEETMKFASTNRVRAMIEKFPLEKAAEAFQKMMTGKVKYRAVLVP